MSMVSKLAYLKHENNLTSEDLARLSGVPLGTVNKICSGQTRNPAPRTLDQICRVLHVPIRFLLDDAIADNCNITTYAESQGMFLVSPRQQEMIAKYACLSEQGRQAVDSLVELLAGQVPAAHPPAGQKLLLCYTPIALGQRGTYGDAFYLKSILAGIDPIVSKADFAVQVTDHTMEPVHLPGTILAAKQGIAADEQIGVFLLNREGYLRKYSSKRGVRKLVAINTDYKDIYITEHDELQCLGVVLGMVRHHKK